MLSLLNLPISIAIIVLVWAIVYQISGARKMKKMKNKIRFAKTCQAPVIRLDDGRVLDNQKRKTQ